MSDADLQAWWPELGTVVVELRRIGRSDVAEQLWDAVRAAAMGSEVRGFVGAVLRSQRALRKRLDEAGVRAWDAVMADVNRDDPLARLAEWFLCRTAGRR